MEMFFGSTEEGKDIVAGVAPADAAEQAREFKGQVKLAKIDSNFVFQSANWRARSCWLPFA